MTKEEFAKKYYFFEIDDDLFNIQGSEIKNGNGKIEAFDWDFDGEFLITISEVMGRYVTTEINIKNIKPIKQ